MKVILLDEVKGKGREGDVIEVTRGFAVNYLLPRQLAIKATSGNIKQLEARRTNIEKRETARRSDAEALAAMLDGKEITIEANSGEEGRLFGSVTSPMIQEAILKQLAVDVDRRKMDVAGHIKTVGDHEISVRLSFDVKATVTVHVVPEGGVLHEEFAKHLEEVDAADEAIVAEEAAEAEEAISVDEADPVREAIAAEIEESSEIVEAVEELVEAEDEDEAEDE